MTAELARVHVDRPALPARKSLVVKFLEKVQIQRGGCWLWRARIEPNGYGYFRHPETTWAHRASYLLFVGPIPDGMTVDHLCYVKACVNPDHLEVVTNRENVQRYTGGWAECDQLHSDTPTRRAKKKNGREHCLECHRVREAARRARGRAAPFLPHEADLENLDVRRSRRSAAVGPVGLEPTTSGLKDRPGRSGGIGRDRG